MMEGTLHPTPRWRDVVFEQIRVVGLKLRIAGLILALVLGVGTIVIGGEILSGGRAFDSDETFPVAILFFVFPFAVWAGERPFRSAFLWTLPVERRQIALARVLAGWVWMMVALATFASWLLALVLLARASPVEHLMRIPFTATVAMYLFGSALVLGLRHPLRWMFGAAGLVMLLGGLSQMLEQYYGVQTLLGSSRLFYAAEDSYDFWKTLPVFAQWAAALFFAIGAGLAALWAALLRHKENR